MVGREKDMAETDGDRREQTREKEMDETRHSIEVRIMKLVACLRHDNAIVGSQQVPL
jgi:hypothetical protein